MNKALLLLWLIVVIPARARAQDAVRVHARLDSAQLMAGSSATLWLEASLDASRYRLQWPALPDPAGPLEFQPLAMDTLQQGSHARYRQQVRVLAFEPGTHQVPAFAFDIQDLQGKSFRLFSDSLRLEVKLMAVDTSKAFQDIKDILPVQTSWLDYLPWILAGLALLIIIVLVYKWLKRPNPAPAPVIPAQPQMSLQEHYIQMLHELEAAQLWQQGHVKEYYSRLTGLLRQYLEAAFGIPALEQTTDELLGQCRSHTGLAAHYSRISELLHTADMAKFARARPDEAMHIQAMAQTRLLIQDTATQPQPSKPAL